tara:strand:- start:1652 stop:4231 length:2580 start_codon:yes stop_codon:yes gene_type:complete
MKSRECILENKNMNDQEKDAALKMYDQYEIVYGSDKGKVAETTFNALEYKSYLRRKQNLISAKVAMERWLDIEKFTDGTDRPIDAIISLISPDNKGYMRGFNMEYFRDAYRARGYAKIAELISKFGKKGMFGFREGADSVLERGPLNLKGNKESWTDILSELWGEKDTGNGIAKALAKSIEDVLEDQRLLINKYGGNIPKLDLEIDGKKVRYNLPQSHDMMKVRSVTEAQWKDDIEGLLDRRTMVNYETNQPFTDMEFQALLTDSYRAIKSNGLTRVDPNQILKNGRKSGSGMDYSHRVFQFKDSASWVTYQKKYGEGDVFNTILNQVEHNAAKIAELKVLGPNSQRTIEYLLAKVGKAQAENPKTNFDMLNAAPGKIRNFMDVYHNAGNQIHNRAWAEALSATRNMFSAIMLGRAVFSALGDFNTQRVTAQDIGMSQVGALKRVLINTATAVQGKNRNTELSKMGVIMDNSINLATAQARYAGEISGPIWSQVIPDVVLRLSGLSPITQAGRNAFGYEFMGFFAEQLGKSYNDLPINFKRMLERYKLDKDWDILSQVKPYDYNGTKMLSWREIDNADIRGVDLEDISTRYLNMMQNLTDDAVIVTSLRERAVTGGQNPRGSAWGEIVKSSTVFKHFAITLWINHITRLAKDSSIKQNFFGVNVPKPAARAILMAEFVGVATLIGGFSLQMKEISKGKDPMDMTTSEFWYRAMAQGGGLGIVGDMFSQSIEGYTSAIGGPMANLIKDTSQLTIGNLIELINGEDPEMINDLTKFAKKWTPGQSIWWSNLIFQRMAIDNVATMIDPKMNSRLNRERRRQESRIDQKYWWRPGETTPRRAPNLEEAQTEKLIENMTDFVTQ